ncbi:nuclear transport factor 2 family protein [Nocardia sp. NPDC049190]|uniref:nuclear transport factor 2 family protein n=1 Tax=Nocardia sp. NPDC049190 TaxID=3155650 RepID=UPI0033DC14F0
MSSPTHQSGTSRAEILRGFGAIAAVGVAGPLLACSTTNVEPNSVHPHVRLIQDYYTAYAAGDPAKLREYFAEDIRWMIPGRHPLSGVKVGADEVLAFFAELGKAGFRAEPISLAADRGWVLDLHRGWSTKPEGLDILWALAFRIHEGKIAEAVNFAADQHAADEFFSQVYNQIPFQPA